MLFENVNFIESACRKIPKDEFIQKHINCIWQDRNRRQRKQMLSDAYDAMNPSAETQEKQSN